MSVVGAEGKARQPVLSPAKTSGQFTPTASFPRPASVSYAKSASEIEKINESSWKKIEKFKKLKEGLESKRVKNNQSQ